MSMERTVLGMKRGFLHRCPECGEGQRFYTYLKVQSVCEDCGHDNGQYPADDAPPYFTILIVGHLIVAPILILPFIWEWPIEWVLLSTLPVLTVFTLWLLPRVKGAVIGLQWSIRQAEGRIPGQEPDRV